VRDDRLPEDEAVREMAAPIVDPSDLDDFVAMAILELHGLHEGNLARYRLRPSELRRWHLKRPLVTPPSVSPPPKSQAPPATMTRRSRPSARSRPKVRR